MEKSSIWGEPLEGIGDNGKPERMTAGMLNFIVTNKGTSAGGTVGATAAFNVNGTMTTDELNTLMEAVFRYGSTEKLALCGSTFLKAVTDIARLNGTINITPASKTYGLKIVEYISPFGTLMMKSHPLFNQHPVYRQNALVLDTQNIKWRPVDDTMFIKNRQDPGEDASKDEYLTEGGYEVQFEETHGYIENVTGGVA
jgi:hypothetical protein